MRGSWTLPPFRRQPKNRPPSISTRWSRSSLLCATRSICKRRPPVQRSNKTARRSTELRSAVDELRERPTSEEDDVTPLLKAIVDVYDNLALALRQVEKQREAIDKPLADLTEGASLPEPLAKEITNLRASQSPGLWSRLFGGSTLRSQEFDGVLQLVQARRERTEQSAKLIRSSFDGLIAGYRMSLARVDRVLEQFNMETIPTEGETFDPELMEVVEVVGRFQAARGTDCGRSPSGLLARRDRVSICSSQGGKVTVKASQCGPMPSGCLWGSAHFKGM